MLQIKEDDKLFSRVVSKESSIANPSFRVYYGGASSSVAVPFVWEAKPGTPKHTKHNSDPTRSEPDPAQTRYPPLTPPPCYSLHNYHNNKLIKSRAPHKLKSKIFFNANNFFPRMLHRRQVSSVSSSSSSSLFSGSDFMLARAQGPARSSLGSLLDFVVNGNEMEEVEDEEEEMRSPKSTLCFGIGCGSRKIRSTDSVLDQ